MPFYIFLLISWHKKCPADKAERLTCALPSGLPLSFSEGKGKQKSRNLQEISGFSAFFY